MACVLLGWLATGKDHEVAGINCSRSAQGHLEAPDAQSTTQGQTKKVLVKHKIKFEVHKKKPDVFYGPPLAPVFTTRGFWVLERVAISMSNRKH